MVNTREKQRIAEEVQGGNKSEGEQGEREEKTIKENKEKEKSIGVTNPTASNQLKRRSPSTPSSTSTSSPLRKSKSAQFDSPSKSQSGTPSKIYLSRKSPREKPRVDYKETKTYKKPSSIPEVETHTPEGGNPEVEIEILIPEGANPEIYTDDQEKLLGNSVSDWTLFVDGFDEDGQRMYGSKLGTSCHQCRLKTKGQHTNCSKCKNVTGHLCGDCLWMRYGENVTEVNLNQDWTCPQCRGICNCNRCRRKKGWKPTGAIYKKVVKLGFKSVAHYLILTRRKGGAIEEPEAAEGSGSDAVAEEGVSDAHPDRKHDEDGDSGSSSDKS